MGGFTLGIDIGTSSIKAALLEIDSGRVVGTASAPDGEMRIDAPRKNWAEQTPSVWWRNVVEAVRTLRESNRKAFDLVRSIGLSYQEHGLVLLDRAGDVVRPAIIWCDGRAVETGERLFQAIGHERCAARLLNSPGNFTAAKMAWVKEYEPQNLARSATAMLPGDYIAYLLTGVSCTTAAGLSEQILFDYEQNGLAEFVLNGIGVDTTLIPPRVDAFGLQGSVLPERAAELGIPSSTVVSFRAGDQHCNSLSMSVLSPGQASVAAGTSGVVFGVTDRRVWDSAQRTNTFVHVNHCPADPRYAVLLCVNGAAISYRWLRDLLVEVGEIDYAFLDRAAQRSRIANRPVFLPFGNGPERVLANESLGASFAGLDFNRHSLADLAGSVIDGVVFAMCDGLGILDELGVPMTDARAGHSGLFRNDDVVRAFATVSGRPVALYEADAAIGAARGAAVGIGAYSSLDEALSFVTPLKSVDPDAGTELAYQESFAVWKSELARSRTR